MLNCLSCFSSRLTAHGYPQPVAGNDDAPDAASIRQFFIDHKGKAVLLGAVALLAGMVLMGLDLFSGGTTLPFTLHLTTALISTGATAIAFACTGIMLGGNSMGPGSDSSPKIRPRGKRAHTRYVTRKLPPAPRGKPVPVYLVRDGTKATSIRRRQNAS